MKPTATAFKIAAVIFVLCIVGAMLPLQTAQGSSPTLTIITSADSHISQANPTSSYGSKTYLTVKNQPTISTYVLFNVTGLKGAAIASAHLRLYALTDLGSGFSIAKAQSDSWNETGITYETAPAAGSSILNSGAFSANQWLDFDVTHQVTAQGLVTFVLTSTSSTAFTLASRERSGGQYAPNLVLTLKPAVKPAKKITSLPTKTPTTKPTQAPPAKPTKAPKKAPKAAPTKAHKAVPTQPAAAAPYKLPGSWKLKFSDDFNGKALDTSKWTPNWLAGNNTTITKPIDSNELSCYDPRQVGESGGSLILSAAARSCTANNGVKYNYASGIVTSSGHFTYTYGYMEARVMLAGGSTIDNWPAVWADGTGSWPTTGEIDTFEGLGGVAAWHYHWGSYSSPQQIGNSPSMKSQTGWHIFGADWEPGSIKYYYDGVLVGTVTKSVVSNPMFVILNYGVSSSIAGSVHTPSTFRVDYIRIWQK